MNKIKITITSLLVLAVVAIGGTAAFTMLAQKPTSVATTSTETVAETPAKTQTKEVTFTAVKGSSVLDQLKQHTTVETQDSSYGPYVTAINGVSGGTDNKYWSFYVGDALAQKGAAEYMPEGGEKITWRLE